MSHKKNLVPALVAALLMLGLPPALAEAPLPAKIQALIQGDDAVALGAALDEALSKTPDDFRLQFLKSLSLMDRSRYAEALAYQDAMIIKFPGVAALHNNRGVARTRMLQYSLAIQDFEEAARLDPGYAIASENLGMAYAGLADIALTNAMKLDQGNARIGKRQELARSLIEAKADNLAPPAVIAPTALVKPVIVPTAAAMPVTTPEVKPVSKPSATVLSASKPSAPPMPLTPPEIKPLTPPEIKPVAAPEVKPVIAPVAEVKRPAAVAPTVAAELPTAAKTVEKPALPPAASPATAETNREKEILLAMEAWRSAWSSKNMSAYFAAYSPTYTPHPSLKDQAAWRLDREKKIGQRSGEIKVSFENPSIVFLPDGNAELKFEQQYRAGDFSEEIRKMFVLSNKGGRWLIEVEKNLILRAAPKE